MRLVTRHARVCCAAIALVTAAAAGFVFGEWKCSRRYADVIREQSKALAGLDPVFSDAVVRVLAEVNAQAPPGRILTAYEGLRSLERQRELFATGYSKIPVGAHNVGRACDLVWVVNGRWTWDDAEPWDLIGKAAHDQGLVWGGNWKSFRDLNHVETPDWPKFVPPAAAAAHAGHQNP